MRTPTEHRRRRYQTYIHNSTRTTSSRRGAERTAAQARTSSERLSDGARPADGAESGVLGTFVRGSALTCARRRSMTATGRSGSEDGRAVAGFALLTDGIRERSRTRMPGWWRASTEGDAHLL